MSNANAMIPAVELDRQARMILNSGLAKSESGIDSIKVKIAFGMPYGLPPLACLANLHVGVGGKGGITMSAACMQAIAMQRGYVFRQLKHDNNGCEIECLKPILGQLVSLGKASFTASDAQQAGLKNPVYKQYPRNMYWARAVANAVRWFCPDAMLGTVYLPEEINPDINLAPNANGDMVPAQDAEVIESPTKYSLPPAIKAELVSLLEKTKTEATGLLNYYGKKRLDDMSQEDAEDAKGKLEAKLAAM